MTPKSQRLTLALLALAAIVAAVLLAMSAMKDQAAFFYTPSDAKAQGLPLGKAVRLGGMVEAGSVHRAPDGVTVRFVVTDGKATTPVTFAGITPTCSARNRAWWPRAVPARWPLRRDQPARQA
ncbi:hypothetical protein GCM10020258_04450 [Sphingomonas yabuuchiae]